MQYTTRIVYNISINGGVRIIVGKTFWSIQIYSTTWCFLCGGLVWFAFGASHHNSILHLRKEDNTLMNLTVNPVNSRLHHNTNHTYTREEINTDAFIIDFLLLKEDENRYAYTFIFLFSIRYWTDYWQFYFSCLSVCYWYTQLYIISSEISKYAEESMRTLDGVVF